MACGKKIGYCLFAFNVFLLYVSVGKPHMHFWSNYFGFKRGKFSKVFRVSAFDAVEDTFASTVFMVFPSDSAPTPIHPDASNFAVGGVLQQFIDNEWRKFAFFFKSFNLLKWGKVLLVENCHHIAIKQIRYFIESREFHIFTDHKPLTHAITAQTIKQFPREALHLRFISQFATDIRYVKGAENNPADTLSLSLSRISVNSITFLPIIDCEEISRLQQQEQFTFLHSYDN